ncbi:MAG: hypothetical protein GFGODING_03242 [Flavobacteriales bacterium]|nr:hypothetical protein [Flavobacteriales bacterium]
MGASFTVCPGACSVCAVPVSLSFKVAPMSPAASPSTGLRSRPSTMNSWPMRSLAPVLSFTSSVPAFTSPLITLKKVIQPVRGSSTLLKVKSTGGPSARQGRPPSPSNGAGGISTALGATLSMKPISRPLPMLRRALRQNTG